MSVSIEELERDIEQSRARLELTLDEIQDRLSIAGLADEMVGSLRETELGSLVDRAVAVARRNPVPVMLAALGIGWLVHRLSREPGLGLRRIEDEMEAVPVLSGGDAGVDEAGIPPRQPSEEALPQRRRAGAQA